MTANPNLGYSDTPQLPGSPYRVHDGTRPQPRLVMPGPAATPDCQGPPPADAVVLFDGTSLAKWINKAGGPAVWKVENGYMEVVAGTGNIRTRDELGDCQLHVEWAAPVKIEGDSQGRGNSGVFLMARYEIQVLDCYRNPTYPDGTTGALYGQCPPLVNACRPPGEWQTYDVIWIGPRFAGDRLVSPARVTVLFNGVLIHHDRELLGTTAHRQVAAYTPHPPQGPLMLQDHGNPVRYRNIWIRELP